MPFPDQNENPENEPMEEGNGGDYDAWFCAMDGQIDFLTQGFNELVAQTMPGMQQQLNATFEDFGQQMQVLGHQKEAILAEIRQEVQLWQQNITLQNQLQNQGTEQHLVQNLEFIQKHFEEILHKKHENTLPIWRVWFMIWMNGTKTK